MGYIIHLRLELWKVVVSDKNTLLFLSGTDSDGINGYWEAAYNHNINEIISKFH